MKKILFAASECVPFIKTGGLADVAGSLPRELDSRYYDVRVILPEYACMKDEWKEKLEFVTSFNMDYLNDHAYVGILKTEYQGITYYFVDSQYYFGGAKVYTDDPRWEIERYTYFCLAVLSSLHLIDFQPDLIHCHDWQTGLIPVYLKERFAGDLFFHDIRSVMTIHNLRFQGRWGVDGVRGITGLDPYFFTSDKLEFHNDADLLKGGLVYADAITTVSPTYAEEIKTEMYGEGLDGLLRARSGDLRGILNGIDVASFDPESDKQISANYSVDNFRTQKPKNKKALQKELGLEVDNHKFLLGIVSRLTDQKGFDIIGNVLERLLQDDIQVAVLGTGDERYENMFRYFAWKYPEKVSANIFYSDELSRKIYASCDAFLMPSSFEPCGLSQLIALRYGTLPIVRETGGLKDTVIPYNEYDGTGTGFSFANYSDAELMNTVQYAEKIFRENRRAFNRIAERAMKADFSWKASAAEYQLMYDWLIDRRSE